MVRSIELEGDNESCCGGGGGTYFRQPPPSESEKDNLRGVRWVIDARLSGEELLSRRGEGSSAFIPKQFC